MAKNIAGNGNRGRDGNRGSRGANMRNSESRVGDSGSHHGGNDGSYGRKGGSYGKSGDSDRRKSDGRNSDRSRWSRKDGDAGKREFYSTSKSEEKPARDKNSTNRTSAKSTKSITREKPSGRAKSSGFKSENKIAKTLCPVFERCGGCQLLNVPYDKQLEQKQKNLEKLLKPFCKVYPIVGMENPYHYRNKVHAVFDHDKKGNPISGVYEAKSHRVVPVEKCLIEDEKADEIIGTIRGMLKSFKILTYDEDTRYGLLRHVLIRRGFTSGQIMVVLVTASPIFPSKNNFVKALREKHPEITTIVQNVNNRNTSMVLGDKEQVLYGKGYIEDTLCGCRFRISSKSFYQVNPVQTEVLYQKAIEAAGLTGKERVIDAYCGIGTIGIVASKQAKEVIGVEMNRDAVRDAVENAKLNDVKNVKFYCNDAGKFMVSMAEEGERADVVFMDPPRSGSTEEFMDSVVKMGPKKVVYVSCGPETLARDLKYFEKKGYKAMGAWGVDLFPFTEHCEICVEICRI